MPRRPGERAIQHHGRQVLTGSETAVLTAALMQATSNKNATAIAHALRAPRAKAPISSGGVSRIAGRLLAMVLVGVEDSATTAPAYPAESSGGEVLAAQESE